MNAARHSLHHTLKSALIRIRENMHMALKIVGAGFGRTGTLSLKLALEQLGFGPCYHMAEVFKNPTSIGWWIDAADGKPDWDKIFAGYVSAVDWPMATFYAEIADFYPDSKVILSKRDAESWFASTQNTIFQNTPPLDSTKPFDIMFHKVVGRLFGNRMHDHDHLISVYNRHNTEVLSRIPKDRLLVYEAKQGWEPLCQFLGVPVPAEPMPSVNSTEDFHKRFRDRPKEAAG
jgi:hypothetical protein